MPRILRGQQAGFIYHVINLSPFTASASGLIRAFDQAWLEERKGQTSF
jgi:hypothetical protein